MRKIEVKIKQIFWALENVFNPTTYDKVKYNGENYYIKSSLIGHNIWDLYKKDVPIYKRIKGDDLKIIHSKKRFVEVFKQHLNFQKNSWGSIDSNKKLGTRLSYINSDNIKF